ncbi:acyl-CoA thioesterase [Azospirillum sp. RWY-5-1]|uniref:Acyl-CoA thioesterase n=1 Tax=Azospirillum oleiclasticum TaxID=2735135 RepID=A0ABX2T4D4_9PROT|nr:acyl-CoA thioesterase [Azospirillum oleiclasticum]NYZ12027.1 acyl-CoA thioesterase [Azospirillum oleiclasticum]NYZ19187.1 acyl-CoA thioesterase [Azospirillum oleiclasticum]
MSDNTPHDINRGPALRAIAMPADANPNGDIFGGWLLSQMDLAGGIVAIRRARGRVATVGVEAMTFHKPVMVGDEVSCFACVEKVGRTSLRVRIEAWVRRPDDETVKVTEGVFTYVAIGTDRKPREVPPDTVIV